MKKTIFILSLMLGIGVVSWAHTNLLSNPGAESNYDGWTKTDGGDGWSINLIGNLPHSGNNLWASSYEWCTLKQTIDLVASGYSEVELDAAPDISAGAFVQNAKWSASYATIKVELCDENSSVISTHYICNNMLIPANTSWQEKSLVIRNYGTGVRKINFYLIGKDEPWWAGYWGTQFDDAYVKTAKYLISGTSVDVTNPGNWNSREDGLGTTVTDFNDDDTYIIPSGRDGLVSGSIPWSVGSANTEVNVLGNLTVSNDVNVNGTLAVQGAGNLDIASGQKVTAGTLINSTGSPYGINLLANNDGVIGSLVYTNGTVQASVQFHSKAFHGTDDYKYQYFGIPFTAMNPNGNFDGTWLYKYDETNSPSEWVALNNTSAMSPIQGYAITQESATTYQLTGTLYHAPITNFPLTYTASAVSPGENILANPYTAAIDIKTGIPTFLLPPAPAPRAIGPNGIMSGLPLGTVDKTIYFFNTGSFNDWTGHVATSGIAAGQYLAVPYLQAGTNVGGIDLPASISSMQGFIIKVNPPAQPAPAPSYLNKIVGPIENYVADISIDVPTIKNDQALRVKGEASEKVCTVIDINGEKFGDRVWLFTEPTCSPGFDNGYDGRKIKGAVETPQFYAQELDGNYQVNSVNDINNTLLAFEPGVDSEYTMTFRHLNTANAYPNGIYLIDQITKRTIDVSQDGSSYSFTATPKSLVKGMKAPAAPTDLQRFKIVTAPGITTATADLNKAGLIVFSADKTIIVDNKSANQGVLNIFDTNGRLVKTTNFATGVNTLRTQLPAGTYVVKATVQQETIKSTLIIN